MSAYAICSLLIKPGRTDGLQIRADMLYACGRLKDKRYAGLTNTLTPAKADGKMAADGGTAAAAQ